MPTATAPSTKESPIGETIIAMDKEEFVSLADPCFWDPGMEEYAGKNGTVLLSDARGNTLEFPGGVTYWYPHRKSE